LFQYPEGSTTSIGVLKHRAKIGTLLKVNDYLLLVKAINGGAIWDRLNFGVTLAAETLAIDPSSLCE
jgi:hypothetical protein